jgi:hypothetical protein
MATNKKITELTELELGGIADDDVLAIVDISAGETKKVRRSTLRTDLTGVASLTATSPLAVDAATGDVTVSISGQVAVNNGGTGASTVSGARSNLGLDSMALQSNSSVNIDGGNIDGTTIGASSAAAITGTTITGTSLDVNGNADIAGNLTMGDNNNIILGTDSDLQIYHDGANSYIYENGTGGLVLRTNQFYLNNVANGETMIAASENGAVTLYYDNNAKLATTSTGIDVTGTVTADAVTISSSGTGTILTVESTDAGASDAPDIIFQRSSGSPAASDNLMTLMFNGKDSAANTQTYAYMQASIGDPTTTTEDGILNLYATVAGANEGVTLRLDGTNDRVYTPDNFETGGNATFAGNIINGGNIYNSVATAEFYISGGSASNNGANLFLYGGSHATKAGDFLLRSGSVEIAMFDKSTETWTFDTNGAQALTINSAQTATFAGDAEVKRSQSSGQVKFTVWNQANAADSEDARIVISSGGSSGGDALIQYVVPGVQSWATGIDNNDSDKFKIAHSSDVETNTALTIDTSGNVGIGASVPAAGLDVRTGLTGNGQFLVDGSTTAGAGAGGAYLKFMGSNGTAAQIAGIDGSMTDGTAGAESGILAFATMASGSSAIRARFTADGEFLINTTSTGSRLKVAKGTSSNTALFEGTGYQTIFGYGANDDNYISSGSSGSTYIRTGGTNRMTINSSGNVGINTTTLTRARVNIDTDGSNTASGYGIALTNTVGGGTTWTLQCGDYAVDNGAFTIRQTGISGTTFLKIGPTNGYLTVPGVYSLTTASAANVFVDSSGSLYRSTSSRRYKNSIEDATHGLQELLELRPVTYKGNNDGDTVFGGLIAEEVHDAGLTEFVQYNSDNQPDSLAYGNMVSLCIKAIQEQQQTITALEARIAALEAN